LKQGLTIKQRKGLITKMGNVFRDDIRGLSTELQQILLDDLATAFQNRISVLIRAQKGRRC
jgi:hypothetical protein